MPYQQMDHLRGLVVIEWQIMLGSTNKQGQAATTKERKYIKDLGEGERLFRPPAHT